MCLRRGKKLPVHMIESLRRWNKYCRTEHRYPYDNGTIRYRRKFGPSKTDELWSRDSVQTQSKAAFYKKLFPVTTTSVSLAKHYALPANHKTLTRTVPVNLGRPTYKTINNSLLPPTSRVAQAWDSKRRGRPKQSKTTVGYKTRVARKRSGKTHIYIYTHTRTRDIRSTVESRNVVSRLFGFSANSYKFYSVPGDKIPDNKGVKTTRFGHASSRQFVLFSRSRSLKTSYIIRVSKPCRTVFGVRDQNKRAIKTPRLGNRVINT